MSGAPVAARARGETMPVGARHLGGRMADAAMAYVTYDDALRTFREACHEAARRTREVTFYELTEAAATASFHTAAMSDGRGRHRVLCHPRGLVAFAAPSVFPGSCRTDFREPPAWAEVFGWYRLRVLRAEVLAAPLSGMDLGSLGPEERAAVRRWHPRTLGELFFNWWS